MMSIQVLTLEQVCKEHPYWPSSYKTASGQDAHDSVVFPVVSNLHDVLRHLVTTLTLSLPLEQVLSSLSTLTMQALHIDLCVILLHDSIHNHFRLCAWAPDLSEKGVNVQPITIDTDLLEDLRLASARGQLPRLSSRLRETLNPLKNVQFETLTPVPLFIGNECIGLLNCYSSGTSHYTDEEQLMLSTIATQAALAIKHRQSVDEGVVAQKKLINVFVNDLCLGPQDGEEALRHRARVPGYDLTRPHSVALIEFSESDELQEQNPPRTREEWLLLCNIAARQIQAYIEERSPGSLIDQRDTSLVCLLQTEDDVSVEQFKSYIDEIAVQMRSERHIQIACGLGNPCHTVGDYQRGYAEANEALEVGRSLQRNGGCTHFNMLGAYRYLYKFAHMDTLHDQYQNQIDLIVDYDRRKKTNLLDTLETYLECGGNVAKTSSHLDVHRNTLLQRLERLQKLCKLDLEQCQHRLPLLVALKIYKLRTSAS
ncbi:MAG: helix-turn-helix domain-containing protein [Ktedonobacteraceae bacterium]|nr:helix-turn-helix domain-containing protein [Ktedonobacteraceae bacterium]